MSNITSINRKNEQTMSSLRTAIGEQQIHVWELRSLLAAVEQSMDTPNPDVDTMAVLSALKWFANTIHAELDMGALQKRATEIAECSCSAD